MLDWFARRLKEVQEKDKTGQKGFTLIELLVVILIIGILAAIALPAFLNQRSKAQDTEAKSKARTAQTALETYYVNEQTYVGADLTALKAIEPALGDGPTLTVDTATVNEWKVTVVSKASGSSARLPCQYTIRSPGTISRH